ncbi:MAG: hypothetical protein ACREH8_19565 [Opitutaceae bacterium]
MKPLEFGQFMTAAVNGARAAAAANDTSPAIHRRDSIEKERPVA